MSLIQEDYPQEVQFAQTVTQNYVKLAENKEAIHEQLVQALQLISVAIQYPCVSKREINEAINHLKAAVYVIEE